MRAHAVLNEHKHQERNAILEPDSAWFHPPDRDYSVEQNLRASLSALPDGQREIVVLHLWGELTFAQISELLGVSPKTAASRYRYALAKLRDAMVTKEDSCANSR